MPGLVTLGKASHSHRWAYTSSVRFAQLVDIGRGIDANTPPFRLRRTSSCEAGEDATSCPADCGGGPAFVCGDDICTADVESCGNCIQDCPCWMPGTTCNPNPMPGVCENVCGNGLCGPGENAGNCSEDCAVECGDAICSVGESCPADCAGCGDGFCDAGLGENDLSCSQDCSGGGVCTVDGVCDAGAGETLQNCSADCGGGATCDFDSVCEAGENATTCPSDCSNPGFVCGDHICTPNVESCGNCLQDCPCAIGTTCSPNPAPGICVAGPALCGNGVLDPGETCENCLRDASSKLRFNLSTTTPMVGESVFLTPDFSTVGDDPIPRWDIGNGQVLIYPLPPAVWNAPGTYAVVMRGADLRCFTTQFSDPVFVTVSAGGGGACNHNLVCDALENSQNCPSDCTQPICDFTDLPPNLQICCGDGICDSGENPNRCARDCEATCGDGLCSPGQGETNTSCSVDCCFSGNTCANGCAAVPYFDMSHQAAAAFELVTFTADPRNIVGSVVNWDFGDGVHCDQCGLTETHRYERPGTYPVRLTATEPICGGAQISFPQYLAISLPPLRDDALLLNNSIPSCVSPNQNVTAQVTLRNVGGTTWGKAFGQHLQMTGGSDEFVPSSVLLAQNERITPGGQRIFEFPFGTTLASEGDRTVIFQMADLFGNLFGDPIIHRVSVRSDCTAPPPPTGEYTCHASMKMADGRGVPGVRVRLQAFRSTPDLDELVAEDVKLTDDSGEKDLAITGDGGVVYRVTCLAESVNSIEEPFKDIVNYDGVIPPKHIDLSLTLVDDFANRTFLPGLKEGSATARLYLGRDLRYDKVVVIPTPFRINEQLAPWTEGALRDRF